jgi:importin subunit beta-1
LILEEYEFAKQNNEEPQRKLLDITVSAVQKFKLVDLILNCLTKQDDNQTEDDWNISSSGATCLSLISKVVGNDMVEKVLPFITKNILNMDDWHMREASILSFSAVLEGPDTESLKLLIQKALPFMLKNVQDDNILVKDTSVFCIGKIAKHHFLALNSSLLLEVLKVLSVSIKDEPRIASKACWSYHHAFESISNLKKQEEEEEEENELTNITEIFETLMKNLLVVSERKDVNEYNLRINCFGAITSLIECGSHGNLDFLEQVLKHFLIKIESTFKITPNSLEEQEQLILYQTMLIGTIQVLTQKLGKSIKQYSDGLMKLYLTIFSIKNVGIIEETFLAVSSLATALGSDFDRYLKNFSQVLYAGLRNYNEIDVCTISINIITDLCTSLQKKIEPLCDEIISILIQNLQSDLDKTLKTLIISCFGDIALAIGVKFQKYLVFVTKVLKQAGDMKVSENNQEHVDYLNLLRESVLTAYIGILQGLKENCKLNC